MYEEQLDETARLIALNMGYRSVPWLGLSYFALVVQMILSMLTQFQRKDFVTFTACAIGFLFLQYPENTRRYQFRMLVLLIGISMAQDVLWFVLNRDVEDDDDDGGVERPVKSFARIISYVSFGWRVSPSHCSASLTSVFFCVDHPWPHLLEGLPRLHSNR